MTVHNNSIITPPRKNFPLSGSNLSDTHMKSYSTKIYFSVLPTSTTTFLATQKSCLGPSDVWSVAVPLNKSLGGLGPRHVLILCLIEQWNSVAGTDPGTPKCSLWICHRKKAGELASVPTPVLRIQHCSPSTNLEQKEDKQTISLSLLFRM